MTTQTPSVDECLMTTPSGAGEKRGLPRNLHWIIIGAVMLALFVVIMSSAVDKEQTENVQQKEQEEAKRKTASGVERPVDPRGLIEIQSQQEAAVPAIVAAQYPKLPPVPGEAGSGSVGAAGPQTSMSKQAHEQEIEAERKRQERQESINASPLLVAVKGNKGGGGAAEMLGGNLGVADLTRKRDEALAAVRNVAAETRNLAGAATGAGAGNPGIAGLPGLAGLGGLLNGQPQQSGAAANQQWMQQQQVQLGQQNALHVEHPASQTVLFQGALIPVVLVTALNSDMPGQIVAMTTSNVYDSIRGEALIIPRGSKLYGQYNAEVQIGQERAVAAFQRVIRPDGSNVNLMGMPAADATGQSGLPGNVNNHFFKMFGYSFMTAGLAHLFDRNRAPTNVYAGAGGSTGSLSGAAGDILVDISKNISKRNANIPPTITVPAGEKFVITVTRDIDIPHYRGKLPGQ